MNTPIAISARVKKWFVLKLVSDLVMVGILLNGLLRTVGLEMLCNKQENQYTVMLVSI